MITKRMKNPDGITGLTSPVLYASTIQDEPLAFTEHEIRRAKERGRRIAATVGKSIFTGRAKR